MKRISIALLVFLFLPISAFAACNEDCNRSCKRCVFGGCFTEPVCKASCEARKTTCQALKEGGKVIEKGAQELGNAGRDIAKEGEKIVKKTFKEIKNGAKDIEILVRTGECGGDVCDALDATKDFVVASIEDAGTSVENFEKRLREGKPIDALWHLAIDPVNDGQENAAEAAMESSILRAVGQVGATVVGGIAGGPAGAAAAAGAYSAWLTYHATDGDMEAALKAGAIAGAMAYAMTAINTEVAMPDIIEGIRADEAIQQAIMTGAVAGTGVALSGGDENEIGQAFTKGAVVSVIRTGYREITASDLEGNSSELEDNLGPSQGRAYCLDADPNGGASCLPDPKAYVPKEGLSEIRYTDENKIDTESIAVVDGKYQIDYSKTVFRRPHVGTSTGVAFDSNQLAETSEFMTGVSRIPGMNGMSVAHDIFDGATNPDIPVVDWVYRVGTIAPFVVMTYEGAGFGVQEMIRDVAARAANTAPKPIPGAEALPTGSGESPGSVEASDDAISIDAARIPVEVRHLVAEKGGERKDYVLEFQLSDGSGKLSRSRVCEINRRTGEDQWRNVWHAHHQRNSCIFRFNRIIEDHIERGFKLGLSVGARMEASASAQTAPN